jgi:hypothetical protein
MGDLGVGDVLGVIQPIERYYRRVKRDRHG